MFEIRLSPDWGLRALALPTAVTCLALLSACTGDRPGADSAADGRGGVPSVAGRDKSIPCLACHGAEGVSDYEAWPDLAGQNEAYLAKQLHDFRDGRRTDPWMTPMALPLSDSDIEALAAYFAGVGGLGGGKLPVAPAATACVVCHAAGGPQPNPLWPALGGQNRRYLAKQLRDFRDGRRQDPVMAPLAATLSDQDIETLAAYYASR